MRGRNPAPFLCPRGTGSSPRRESRERPGLCVAGHLPPLILAPLSGLLFACLSFPALLFIIIRKIIFGDPVSGWASAICVIIFIGGVQLAAPGIMGQCISKTFPEVKKRPHYIVAETNRENTDRVR